MSDPRYEPIPRDGIETCNHSKYCCVGIKNGNAVTLWRCGRDAALWPFVCMVGPHWGCIFVVFSLVIGSTIPFVIFMYVYVRCIQSGLMAQLVWSPTPFFFLSILKDSNGSPCV
jgi:hypothetical protein